MTTKSVLLTGVAVGLCMSIAVLTLLWFGVAGVLNVGRTNLMYVVWPSSLMLTVGWRSTFPGIVTTMVSVALNCLLYMAVTFGLHRISTVSKSARV